MAGWKLTAAGQRLAGLYGSLAQVFAADGRRVTRDPSSECLYVEHAGQGYYLKRYWAGGKGRPLRRWLSRFFATPRVKLEWQNLQRFARWGIPTAELVGYGLERRGGAFVRGALITRELPGTLDLAQIAQHHPERLRGPWLDGVSRRLAQATRCMHGHSFAHNDLKWRNLLVNGAGELFFIDCPTGSFWWGPLLRYRIIKDLACLDKVASKVLSRSQRLRFYLHYSGQARLSAADKRRIGKILRFFEGRE